MINAYSIGFVLTAGTVLAGVDYYDQSNKAGFSLGQMTAGAYIETIPDRFSSAKEEKLAEHAERERKSRWRQGGQVYLPEAPDGWERRALLEGDDSAILPPEAGLKGSMSNSAGKGFLQQMEARDHVQQLKERATQSWIYQRGTETVFVEVRLVKRPSSNSIFGIVASAMDSAMMDAFDRNVGYGVIGGFGLTEKLRYDGARPYHFRYLEGAIGFGDEVHLRVHANASRESTEEILSRIDYDGLNNLLPRPMPSVGNDAVLPEGIDPVALSMELHRLKSEFLGLRALEAQYKIQNIDTGAMVLSAYTMRLGGMGSDVDITGGKVTDLSGLIELGYYRGREAVMAGKSANEVQDEVKQMVDTVMMVADAETAAAAARAANAPEPEMSPELQAEMAALSGATNIPLTTGQQLRTLDAEATEAAGGKPISQSMPSASFKALQASMNVSDKQAALTFQGEAQAFAMKYKVSPHSCSFSVSNVRIECSEAPETDDVVKIAAANRARDMDNSASGKILMQVDEEKSDREAGKILSKAIDYLEFEKFREARNATNEEMEMGMAIAASGFERKHDLPQGSCSFDMGALRLECDTSKGVQPNGLLSKLINQVTGGEEAVSLTPQSTEPAAKPKRLELSNGNARTGQRCVGSFCD